MPAVNRIRGIQALTSSIRELKLETEKNTKEATKVAEEVKKLNEHNEENKVPKPEELPHELDPYPVAKYQPNDMTLSQMLVRKLDII